MFMNFARSLLVLPLLLSSTAIAEESPAPLILYPPMANTYTDEQASLFLAAADTDPNLMQNNTAETDSKTPFQERWFTGNKFHQYLGLGSIGMAVIAAALPKEEDGPHEYFARGAAFFGGAAVATGLAFHFEDLSLKGGFSNPDNMHAALSTLGAIGFMLAIDKAPEGGHAGMGISGTVLMLGGIKYTW
ncbi:MAG: hypothetical protein OEZ68_07270 [Gammaproteobacteria bacterium]|nr:hypothetical protein [Gammaproteobacteria bacterium]MDH5800584.1 hypothetical protein [Gammaproteobacteria bacterium]